MQLWKATEIFKIVYARTENDKEHWNASVIWDDNLDDDCEQIETLETGDADST